MSIYNAASAKSPAPDNHQLRNTLYYGDFPPKGVNAKLGSMSRSQLGDPCNMISRANGALGRSHLTTLFKVKKFVPNVVSLDLLGPV